MWGWRNFHDIAISDGWSILDFAIAASEEIESIQGVLFRPFTHVNLDCQTIKFGVERKGNLVVVRRDYTLWFHCGINPAFENAIYGDDMDLPPEEDVPTQKTVRELITNCITIGWIDAHLDAVVECITTVSVRVEDGSVKNERLYTIYLFPTNFDPSSLIKEAT